MTIKPIRSSSDYEISLEQAKELIGRTDQKSVDDLEILQALIERWERIHHPINVATAVEAIKFRMDQLNLKPRDLAPYLGAKSRISEILNGQRQLTVDQIRALHQHLGIPVSSLVGSFKYEPTSRQSVASIAATSRLKSLGVIAPTDNLKNLVISASKITPAVAMLRKTRTERTNAKTDIGALEAWCSAVIVKSESLTLPKKPRFLRDFDGARKLAKLSVKSNWANQVHDVLASMGIILVILEHFPGTFLDGAAIRRSDGSPVIALTLRHDRLDNFWFTLLHEYAHVACHLTDENSVILDDLDVSGSDGIEAEADEFARDALIPAEIWKEAISADMDLEGLLKIAQKAGVHPAIAAGRWRWENSEYRRFTKILGHGMVRAALNK